MAWNEALRLATLAQGGLQGLQHNLDAQNFKPEQQDQARDYIAKQSPP